MPGAHAALARASRPLRLNVEESLALTVIHTLYLGGCVGLFKVLILYTVCFMGLFSCYLRSNLAAATF